METIRVLRVENVNGHGPFMLGYCLPDYFRYVNKDGWKYPVWYEDGIKVLPDERRYGCQTFDLFLHWFEPAISDLAQDGFGIAEYEVFNYELGYHQVVFAPDSARKLCWIPLKEFM